MAVTTRPATAADITAYYGAPQRPTLSAVMLIKEGQPVGIIGIARGPTRQILFSESRPELGAERHCFAVGRAVFSMLRQALACKLPLYAVKEPDSDVLPRLGFEQVSGDLYRWPS